MPSARARLTPASFLSWTYGRKMATRGSWPTALSPRRTPSPRYLKLQLNPLGSSRLFSRPVCVFQQCAQPVGVFPGGIRHNVILQAALLPSIHHKRLIAGRRFVAHVTRLEDEGGYFVLPYLVDQLNARGMLDVDQFGPYQLEG